MIKVKNLCLKYTKEYYALYDVSFEVKKGESVALLGEENSGKTSMLRVLAGLEKPNSGEVYIKDVPLKKIDFSCDVEMGYIPATPVFFPKKTVYENLKYILKTRKYSNSEIEEKINELLINYNMEKLRDEKVCNLTLFEQYVLSIARLSFRKLDIILIDNIFEKLQPEQLEIIESMIVKEYVQNKVTTLVATTSEDIAKILTKRTIRFNLGSIESN